MTVNEEIEVLLENKWEFEEKNIQAIKDALFISDTSIYFPEVQIIGLPVLPVKSLRKIRTNNLQYQLINRNSHMKFCYNKNKVFGILFVYQDFENTN